MELLLVILGVIGGAATFVCTIAGSAVMVWGASDEFIDIFRVHKNLYKNLRTEYNLNKIGSIIPLIFITPFFIPAMIISLLTAAIIFICAIISIGYCKIFKKKEEDENGSK